MTSEPIGRRFPLEERDAFEVIAGLGPVTVVASDPPWTALSRRMAEPVRVVIAGGMERTSLEAMVAVEPDASEVVVGMGGGSALDTAKYLAWRTGKRLVQVPTITSVDAGFTDSIGVRVDGRVRYIGKVEPELVVLDVPLVRSSPPALNRAGIGDVLSCHTGMEDWRLATEAGEGPGWRDDLAALGHDVLDQLDAAAEDIASVTPDGVRFLASAYRRVGAACAAAQHSRFEEGSEHFWAYAYEHATGHRHVHGELVTLGVALLAHVQGNDPAWVLDLVGRCGTRAHPQDLGIAEDPAVQALVGLHEYARAEALEVSVADLTTIDEEVARAAWHFALGLPRVDAS